MVVAPSLESLLGGCAKGAARGDDFFIGLIVELTNCQLNRRVLSSLFRDSNTRGQSYSGRSEARLSDGLHLTSLTAPMASTTRLTPEEWKMMFTTIRKGTQLLTSKGKSPKAWLDSHKDDLPLEVYLELRGVDFRLYDAKDTWEATLTRLEADMEGVLSQLGSQTASEDEEEQFHDPGATSANDQEETEAVTVTAATSRNTAGSVDVLEVMQQMMEQNAEMMKQNMEMVMNTMSTTMSSMMSTMITQMTTQMMKQQEEQNQRQRQWMMEQQAEQNRRMVEQQEMTQRLFKQMMGYRGEQYSSSREQDEQDDFEWGPWAPHDDAQNVGQRRSSSAPSRPRVREDEGTWYSVSSEKDEAPQDTTRPTKDKEEVPKESVSHSSTEEESQDSSSNTSSDDSESSESSSGKRRRKKKRGKKNKKKKTTKKEKAKAKKRWLKWKKARKGKRKGKGKKKKKKKSKRKKKRARSPSSSSSSTSSSVTDTSFERFWEGEFSTDDEVEAETKDLEDMTGFAKRAAKLSRAAVMSGLPSAARSRHEVLRTTAVIRALNDDDVDEAKAILVRNTKVALRGAANVWEPEEEDIEDAFREVFSKKATRRFLKQSNGKRGARNNKGKKANSRKKGAGPSKTTKEDDDPQRCFNCDSPDHLVADCHSKTRLCHTCKSPDHLKADCPKRNSKKKN